MDTPSVGRILHRPGETGPRLGTKITKVHEDHKTIYGFVIFVALVIFVLGA
jgi:hypothetical protein